MKPSAAVSGAIEILQTRGWCQSVYENMDGACCLMGAINTSIFGNSEAKVENPDFEKGLVKHQILGLVRHEVNVESALVKAGAISFNDTPGRTKEEVVAVLDRVKATLVSYGL